MRKRNISMARAYLAFYILFAFAAAIPAFLAFKFAPALSIVIIVVECLCLAGVICSNVFYDKEMNNLVFFVGIPSYILFDLFVLFGFILEIVYTIQGEPAPYAWMIAIISILALVPIDFFAGLGMYRIIHPIEKI